MTMTTIRVLLSAYVLMLASAAAAQPPAAPAPAKPGETPKTEQAPPPPVAPPYTYDPQGRRDPFVSLIARGSDPRGNSNRPAGLPGMLINEVSVKGILHDRSGYIGMIQGPNTKIFNVRTGDKLMDGTVKAITADAVVFSQDVNDPLSMVKQKEIRKTIRSTTGGRE
jgi:type IV pilus assembly protein PilP